MNSILWSQGASPTEADVFVIDGAMNKDQKSDNNQLAYNKLLEMSDETVIHPKVVKLLHHKGVVQSYLFMATRKKGDGIFFKSNYKTVDEAGRNVAYMFYCKTDNIDHAYKVFLKSSGMADRVAFESERKALKLLFNLNKYGIIALTGILILALWKIIS